MGARDAFSIPLSSYIYSAKGPFFYGACELDELICEMCLVWSTGHNNNIHYHESNHAHC